MLISDAYRDLNSRQHHERPDWGLQSAKYAEFVKELCDRMKLTTFLDYGCGKRALEMILSPHGIKATNYDPAFPEYSTPPEPHELVVCTDVLEHIEPECLDDVLKDLKRVTKDVAFFVVATRASIRNMPDGTNPHRIVEGKAWWYERIRPYFSIMQELGNTQSHKYFSLLVKPKGD